MAVVYFDSSAYVKLLVEEDGSDLAAELWDGCDAAVSSRLAHPEVRAALAAAQRAGRLARTDLAQAETAWEVYWAATRPVELSRDVARQAGELAGAQGLRGADAVHLAALLAVGSDVLLAAWDARLRQAALDSGVAVVPRG
jgi:predicted nucleic acid-binding protein